MQHHPPLHHHKPSLSQSSMELVLSPSYASAANSSLTGSTASASASISASTTGSGGMVEGGASSSPNNSDTCDKDNVASRASPVGGSIPHLLSTDYDNDSDDDGDDNDDEAAYLIHHIGSGHEEGFIATSTRSNSFRYTHRNYCRSGSGSKGNDDNGNDDNGKFQSMLLEQQRQADEPRCPDDSVIYHSHGEDDAASYYTYPTQTVSLPPPPCSCPPLEDDVESSLSLLHTKEERSNYNHHHRDLDDPWTSTGKNLLSKFSRSAAKSISNSARHPQEVIQPITMMIELDDNDEDLPWMLSQPGFGKVDAAMNRGGSVHDSESGEEDGQSSSPLQDDGGGPPSPTQRQLPSATTVPTHRRYPSSLSSTSSQSSFRSILRNGTGSGSIGSNNNRTPLLPRSSNWYASFIPDDDSFCLDLQTMQAKEKPESVLPLRGRSAHVEDHDTRRGRRSASDSAQKSRPRRDEDGRGDVHQHRRLHRRTVSFPADLIAKDNTSASASSSTSRHPNKSPRSLPPPGSQSDPNLTPLLDMGSSRTRKKLPAHMKGATEISPRTADFLAHEPVAVTALCNVQDRERYGHLLGPPPISSSKTPAPASTASASAAVVLPTPTYSGRNTYPPPARSSQSPTKRLQASYQRRLQSEAANRLSSVRTDPHTPFAAEQGIDIGDYMSPASKMGVFSFSNADRKSKLSSTKPMRRRKRLPNVDLLSPVEETGGSVAGSAATTFMPTPKTADINNNQRPYSLPVRRTNIHRQLSFASDGSCEIRDGSTSGVVSPLTLELQKAARVLWQDAETSPSSASSSSRASFSVVATQCQCTIS